jgi:DNA invertase Pin-like site-specific DNA recombinase
VTKARASFKSLADTWADTTTPHGRLVVTVLAGLAEFERDLIRQRTGDGRVRAKATGVKFGRPSKLAPRQAQEAIERRTVKSDRDRGVIQRQSYNHHASAGAKREPDMLKKTDLKVGQT